MQIDANKRAKIDIYLKNFLIRGEIVVANAGQLARVSDILNDSRPFIPLLNAEIYTHQGQKVAEEHIIIFRKDSVDFIIPFSEPKPENKPEAKLDSANSTTVAFPNTPSAFPNAPSNINISKKTIRVFNKSPNQPPHMDS